MKFKVKKLIIMGTSGSRFCKENLVNPDYMSVITLTDSLVQKLPLDDANSSPLEKEAREQNIDDFWKDRMECMENAFMDSLGLSEKEFHKMEKHILNMSPPIYKPKCPVNVMDVTNCMTIFAGDSLKCEHLVKKFLLCIDTTTQDETRRACLQAERAKRNKCKKN